MNIRALRINTSDRKWIDRFGYAVISTGTDGAGRPSWKVEVPIARFRDVYPLTFAGKSMVTAYFVGPVPRDWMRAVQLPTDDRYGYVVEA